MNNSTAHDPRRIIRTMKRFPRALPLFLSAVFVAAGILVCCSDASAYQVKRVVRGTAQMSTSDETLVVDISGSLGGVNLDLDHSLLLFSYATDQNAANQIYVMGMIDDETHLSFNRRVSGTIVDIQYQVIEFLHGVTVTSGVTIFADSATVLSKNIKIPDIPSLSKAFVIISSGGGSSNRATRDEAYYIGGRIVDTSTIQIARRRGSDQGTANLEVYYQVVSFAATDADVTVQHGNVNVLMNAAVNGAAGEATDNGTTLTVTIPSAVTPAYSFLYFTYMPNTNIAGVEQGDKVDGILTNGTTLTFRRIANTNDVQIWWQVVQIKNPTVDGDGNRFYGLYAQTNRIANSALNTAQTVAITALYEKRDFCLVSASGGGAADNTSFDETTYYAYLDAAGTPSRSSNIIVKRNSTALTNANISWQAVELPPLNLISPNGSETWVIGQPVTISWEYSDDLKTNGGGTGGVHRLKIELTKDGTNYLTIADNVDVDTGTLDNTGSYTWTCQQDIGGTSIIGENTRVRITDNELSSIGMERKADRSDSTFVIKGALTVTQPPDTWKIGETQSIQWSYVGKLSTLANPGNTVTVAVDPGSGYVNIVTNQSVGVDGADINHPGSGSYSWTIPSGLPVGAPTQNLIGTDNKVKVTLNYNPAPVGQTLVQSESAAFTLTGQISGVTPVAAPWLLGQTVTISWSKKGYFGAGVTDGNVKVYYSPTGFAPYTLLTDALGLSQYPVSAGTDAGGGSVSWTIPLTTTTSNPNSTIKVEQSTDSSVYAESATFKVNPTFTLTSPAGGENWKIGETHNVLWTPHGSLGTVLIKYALNDDWGNATTIATRPAGNAEEPQSYPWTITDPIGLSAKLRIVKSDDANVYVQSGSFCLKPVITINTPGAGSIVKVTEPTANNVQSIVWTYSGGITGKADISISSDATGDNFPTVLSANTVDINSLGGNSGSYSWTVAPGHIGTQRVRVAWHDDSDTTLATGSVGHSGVFKTVAYLQYKSPEPGDFASGHPEIGDEIYIKWTPYPANSTWKVLVRYSTQSGADGTFTGTVTPASVDANTVPSGGTDIGYKWTIPDTTGIVSKTVRFQVVQEGKESDVYSKGVSDIEIRGKLALTGEANGVGSPVWLINTPNTISWDCTGGVGDVNIKYAKDGINFNDTVATVTCNSTNSYTYSWTIPGEAISGDLNTAIKLKLLAKDNSTVSAPSAGPITIRANITNVLPAAGTTVFVSDTDNVADTESVSWKSYYPTNIPNVKLKLYNPKTTSWEDINQGNPLSNPTVDGLYGLWQVPNAIGDTAKVRVYSASVNGNVVLGESDTAFKIKGKFRIDAPTLANAGANALKVNSAAMPYYKTVIWKNCGDIGTAKLYFSANGGAYQWVVDLDGTNGTKTYNWYPPATWNGANTIGTTNKLKVTAAGDETVVYRESENFEIKGQLAISTDPLKAIGGKVFAIGPSNYIPIYWDYAGNLGNIDIWFSSDGSTWEKKDTIDVGHAQPYNLLVPDAPTLTGYIKLESVADSAVTSTSTPFRIRGDITNAQVHNTPWKVNGSNNRITWDRTGAIAGVKIDLDTLGGGSGYTYNVAANAPNSGEFIWTIPSADYATVTSDTCRIRLRDAGDPTVESVIGSDFAIKPVITLTHPQGQSDSWEYGTSHDIQWDYLGAITNVKLQFSDDNGSTWSESAPYVIATSTSAAAKSYAWSVPDKMSGQCFMRITKVGDASVTDDSDSAFRIKAKLSILQPSGSAIRANSSYQIQWSTAGTLRPIGTVKLEYSLDNGATWNAISGAGNLASPDGTSNYSWSIPDQASAAAYVRVTSNDESSITGQSTSSFSLKKLNLLSPNGNEHWEPHVAQTITWTSEQVGTVRAYYSIDGGTNWTLIGTAAGANGSMPWTIGDTQTVSQNCKVKLEDLNYTNINDVSDAVFDIKEYLRVTAPLNGLPVIATDPCTITWDKYGTGVTNVLLEYSKDGGISWNYVNPVNPYLVTNSGSYLWTVPADALSLQAQIRVTDPGNSNATHTGTNFWIKGLITVTTPSGSESWNVGTSHNLAWTKKGNIPLVNIYYSADDGTNWTPIGSGVSGTSPWQWDIAGNATLTILGKIKIEDAAFTTVSGISSNNFEIKGNIYNVTVAPLTGDILQYNGPASSFNVSWDYQGAIATVQIYYSTDGGLTYPPANLLGEVSAALKPATFNIPNAIGTNLKIKVAAKANPNVFGESTGFKIKGAVAVNQPNGTEAWVKGSTQQVLWTPTGTYQGNVLIEYSTDGGSSWTTIATKASGADGVQQSQNWLIPDAIGTNNLVRVTTQVNAAIDVTDQSDAPFKIRGAVVLSAPNGGNNWYVGETNRSITWSATGTVTPVKIEYSTDNGGSWTELTHTFVGAEGANTYPWNPVPNEKSDQCQVRVSDARTDFSSLVTATSAADFSILPQITVTQPTVGANIPASSNGNPLRWTITGSPCKVNFVNIEYSIDGGAWTTIQNNVDAAQGTTYVWNGVPAQRSSSVKVRVYDRDKTSVVSESAVFNIVGNLQITAPSGSPRERWAVGASHNITWTSSAVNTVKAYLSLDGGTSFPTLIGSAAGAGGTMAWAIADNQQVSNNAKVKITDQDNESVVFSVSPAAFDIIATFDITHPENGDEVIAKDPYSITWTKKGTGVNNIVLEYSTDGGTNYSYVNPVNPYTVTNSGSYTWPSVPESALSPSCKIRITDPNNSYATDTGLNTFWIKGEIDITSPNDGTESWGVGTKHNITWTKKGNIPTVEIFYSTDSGTSWTNIASGVSGAGTWEWDILPATILSTHARIKVADSAYQNLVKDVSASDFKVKGTLSLTAPTAAGIVMTYGAAPYTITWTRFGTIATVKLLYSTDGGLTYPEPANIITTGRDASTQNFSWAIPNKIGTNLKVKIIDEDNATVSDESANAFAIKGGITVDQPNGSESWIKGTTQQIRWTPVGTYNSNVLIEYSLNGLSGPWTQIATPAAGADGVQQSQNWLIPDQIGSDVRVRATTQKDASIDVSDSSNGSFKIRGDITLNTPNGGNVWYVGETTRSIDWSSTGTVTPVKIEYSTDNGGSWTELTHTFVGAEGSNTYPWNPVPNLKSEQCLVRVSDARSDFTATVTDTSNAVFSIRPQITVTLPAAAANVPAASNGNPLRWTITGSPSKVNFVNVEYSIDGGAWQTIQNNVDAAQGSSYVWDGVPASRSSNVRVRVIDAENSNVAGISGVFNIVGNLNLTSPTGSPRERWQVGASHNITWTSAAVNTVKAYYSLDGGTSWTVIGTAAGAGGTMPWAMADGQQVSNNAKVKITDQDNETVVYSISPSAFDIIAVFDVTHPENGDTLTAEDPYLIQWTKKGSGVTDVILEYSTDGGAHYNYVNPVSPYTVPNNGNYSWPAVVGTVLSYDCKLRITDPNNAYATDTGAGQFRIKGSLTLTSPTVGNESWGAGSSHDITWTKKGNIATLVIEYSPNEGQAGSWQSVVTGVSASPLKWTWNIPADVTLTTKGRIKITSEAESDVSSSSANNFEIKGNLVLNTPQNAGIALAVGDSYDITWTKYGAVAFADLYLSTNGGIGGGGSYPMVPFASVAASEQKYTWTIPDSISKTCRIMVKDQNNGTVWSESANNFEIKGKVVVNVPNGGEKWFYNEGAQIRWTPTGTYAQVKIEYSTDNFATSSAIDQVDAGASGIQQTYNWASVSIPVAETVRIRISDPLTPTVQDVSNADFSVRGRLTLNAPNGPEVWTVDTKHNITWNTKGNIPQVDLSYSTDGNNYTAIVSTLANAGSYEWTIPNAVSDNVTVRVADSRYPTDVQVADVSDAAFKIVAGITLTSPVGNEDWGVGTTQSITWTAHGNIPTVEIRYSDDSGQNYLYQITASTSGNTGSYSWSPIPNNPKTTCKVKVMDTRKPDTVFDVSPQTFSIVGSLTLTKPEPNEEWLVGAQKEITWNANGTIPRVKVLLSLDNGTSYEQITDNASGGSYFWDIPLNKCSPNALIKIIDFNNPRVFDVMDGAFKLQAQFTFNNPLAGQVYTVDEICAISWNTTGVVPDVRLEYKKGTDAWANIIASIGNSGSYNWQVPDKISESVIVKVSDVRDHEADKDSGAFRIRGAVLLTQPKSGDVWIAETAVTINWNVTGSIAFVDLFYSADGGLTYPTAIATNAIASNKTLGWTAPQHVTDQARVKITETGNATVANECAVFTLRGSIAVTSPNGPAAQWEAGTAHNITWTRTGDFANVKITLSNNSGGSFNYLTIANPWSAAGGSYSWGIPDDFALGTHYRVRIADAANETNVYDDSDADFAVVGSLTLTVPNAGATWYVAESQDIKWTKHGNIAYIGIDLSTNGFADESQTYVIIDQTDATGTPAGSYKYSWAVQDYIGTNLKVRIKDYTNPTNVYATSAVPFTIKGVLTLDYPNGGDTLIADEPLVIRWTPRGTIPTVKLEYSTNSGTSYDYVITNSCPGMTGSFTTTVPSVISNLVKVRVSDTTANRSQADDSDANFAVKGKLTLTSPVTLVSWQVGTQHNITWNRNGPIQNVRIDYTTDGWATSNEITALTDAATGSYQWTIPPVISSTVRVKVTDKLDSSVSSVSPVDFKLVGIVAVTEPTAATRWEVGLPQNIFWTKTGPISNVKIDLSKDDGTTWSNIVMSVGGTQYSYTPGNNDVSTTAKIRVSDATDPTVADTTAAFHIKARFTVTSPAAGNVWPVASPQSITWSTIGSVATVKLEYTKNGTTWTTISASTANTGNYPWIVPNAISTTCQVRVSDFNDAEAIGLSGVFKIRGDISLSQPSAAGISWTVDSLQQIIWTTTGTLSTVALQYSYDDGGSWNNIATGVNATSGTPYSWTIPDHLSKLCKVKVISDDDATVYATSANNFTIKGQLSVSEPTTSTVWRVNGAGSIQWTRVHGNIQYVNIEYSTTGPTGPFSHTIASNVLASLGVYNCAVQDTISQDVYVRVSDRDNSDVSALSQQFAIKGKLTLTRPVGNERFVYNTSEAITWNLDGNISTVTLQYTTNNGTSYTVINNGVNAANKTYAWTVPNVLSANVKVRISDNGDPNNVYDMSALPFKIVGVLSLVSPGGGEVWPVDSTQSVTWSTGGSSVQYVKLEYSIDDGSSYPYLIADNVQASLGTKSFTVPDTLSSAVVVKVTDTSESSVYANSSTSNPIKIRGDLVVTRPTDGQVFLLDSTDTIQWTRYGSIPAAKIQYSTDGGSSWSTITNSYSHVAGASQSYSWGPIPNPPTMQAKVRVSVVGDPTVYSDSPDFVVRGGFRITEPNAGTERWAVGSEQSIKWQTFGTYANVKLFYSKDNGATWSTIIASTSNSGDYPWTVQDAISDQCLIRVMDVIDSAAMDVSDNPFKIHGVLAMASPVGGEKWGVGTTQTIRWTKVGTINTVKLEYSTNAFADESQVTLINGNVPSGGATPSYSWPIPDRIGNQLKVRVSVASDATVYAVSPDTFTIRGSLAITSPNGGQNWISGSDHAITWTTQGTVTHVNLEYSTDAGTNWTSIVQNLANTNTYNWTLPNIISKQCRVRVSDSTDSDSNDMSDVNFNIHGDLGLTAPVGGEKWPVATNQLIQWNTTGPIQFIGIEYSANNGSSWIPIVASTPNAGKYSWTIPDNLTTQALVKIYDASDLTVTSVSPAVFKIQGSFTVTSPNGGNAWQAANTYPITWSWNGNIGFVNLYYSKDSGVTWTAIALSVANAGTYDWFIPVEAVSTQCRVKVASSADTEAMDTSNNDFRVRCTLVLTYPNGGEQLRVGRTYNVTWNKVGNPAQLTLEYSPDNFLDPMKTQVITTTASSVSPYAWTVPNYICNTTRLRISDTSDPGAKSVSAADFRITADVRVTAPNGGQSWAYDSVQTITWTSNGTLTDVKIEYTYDGVNYSTIKAVSNTGSTTWQIPDHVSDLCRVRISDLSDSTADDISDAAFSIVPTYQLTSPNGTEIWTVGDVHAITWTCSGTVVNVRLDYSTDSGTNYGNVISASTPNDGSFDWTVPNSISTQVRVRVGSALTPAAFDASNADFKIRGSLRITSPNGGEAWQISQPKSITWVTTGTIANVRILYSTDGGSTFPNTIINSVGNTNSYSWTVPDNRTPSARIRVINVADTTVSDDSDADFRIQGYLSLTAPNGGETWLATDTQQIKWAWGGTMAAVKLSYSTDGGADYAYVINAAAPNGAGSAGNYTYNWTVPGTLSHTCRVKVEDTADNTVYDVSNADFRINGSIAVTSPVGNERWVTNEHHTITWTYKGTIPNVKLLYSKDGFGTSTVIAASAENTGTYDWQIPDDRSTTVKVRVLDVDDETIYGTTPVNFKIDYYTINWDVRDLLTNERLTNLSVTEKITGGAQVGWQAVGLTSPVSHGTPYGYWTTVWSATGYGDKGQNFTADKDQSFSVYLETSAVHIWRSEAQFTYDATGDNLKVTAWLERDGSVVQGAAKVGIYIYDDTGSPISYNTVCDSGYYNYDSNGDGEKDQCNPKPTLFSTTIDPSGYFYLTLPAPTNLKAGVVYAALVDITNLGGAHFKTPTSFSITEAKRLESTESAVNNMANVVLPNFQQSVQNTITNGINEQKQTITNIMVGEGGDPTTIMKNGGMVGMLQSSLTSFETKTQDAIKTLQSGAQTAVEAGQELQATAKKYSWRGTVSPDPALTGDDITLTVQGQPGLQPMLTVYSWDSKSLVASAILTEKEEGVYYYTFKADTNFTPGKAYTYVVTEQVTQGMVSGSGMVESMGITTVAGLAAAAPEAERAAKKALDAIQAVQAAVTSNENINIAMTLKNLKDSVESLPETLNKEGPNSQMMKAVNQISETLKGIMGKEGLDFSSLLDEKLGDSSSIKQMRNKTDTISAIVDLLLQIMESKLGGVDSPIISTSLQSGSVKFRIVALNPSKTKVQKVQVKKYLPEEVKPKDVMDLGGMELEFDSEKGIYYVYKNDLELQPNEVRVYEVEVEDIWMIPDSELSDLREQTQSLTQQFANTAYADRAKETGNAIYQVLDEIPKSQLDDTVSREQHIGVYRQNKESIRLMKERLAELEKLLQPEKGKPDLLKQAKTKVNQPTKNTTWFIILAVIVFLGLLGGIFFFGWQSQIRASQNIITQAGKAAFPGAKPEDKAQEKK